MKLLDEVDRACSGESMSAEAVLRLAARVERARSEAPRTEAGLYEIARDRLLVAAITARPDGLRVERDPTDATLVWLRPPAGRRAPKASLPLDRVPEQVRAALALVPETTKGELVPGLDIRPVDAVVRARLEGRSDADCIAAGREAEAEFDYPRAVNAFRLAVLRSRGARRTVVELVRFLSEVAADYHELTELLASPAIDVEADRPLHVALAEASFSLGLDEEARQHYETLADERGKKLDDRSGLALVHDRLGILAMRRGDAGEGALAFRRAMELDASRLEVRRRLDQAETALRDAETAQLASVQAAIDEGDLALARRRLSPLQKARAAVKGGSGAVDRTHKSLEILEKAALARERLEQALAAEAKGELREALLLAKNAQALDAEVGKAATLVAQRLDQALQLAEAAQQERIAAERLTQGDRVGSARAMAKALTIRRTPLVDGGAPLHTLVSAFMSRRGFSALAEKDLDALLTLDAATERIDAGELAVADARLKDARRTLKDDPLVTAVQTRLASARAETARRDAIQLLAQADAFEASGADKDALLALDRVVALAPDLGRSLDARRVALRARIDAAAAKAAERTKLERLLEVGAVFKLSRLLAETPGAFPDLDALVAQRMATEFPVGAGPVAGGAVGGTLNVGALGLADQAGKRVVAVADDQEPRVVLGAGHRIAWFELPTLKRLDSITLPDSVSVEEATTRLFPAGDRFVIVDAEARRITTLQRRSGTWTVIDQASFERAIGPGVDSRRLASELIYDASTHRLLVVLTDQTGRHDSRLLAIDASDGAVVGEERSAAPLFNLRRIHGTGKVDTSAMPAVSGVAGATYTVQRAFDLRRTGGKPFYYALTDGRAKLTERVNFEDLEAPMHAIRKIAALDDGSLFLQYWPLDAFSGQPVETINGFLKLRPDHTLYYQNVHPELWLGDGRQVAGTFERLPGSRAIVLPWQAPVHVRPDARASRQQKRMRYGLVAVGLERFDRLWDVELPETAQLLGTFGHAATGQVAVLVQDEGQAKIMVLDPEKRRLG